VTKFHADGSGGVHTNEEAEESTR